MGVVIGVTISTAIGMTGGVAYWGIDIIGSRGIIGVGGWSTIGVGSYILSSIVAITVG